MLYPPRPSLIPLPRRPPGGGGAGGAPAQRPRALRAAEGAGGGYAPAEPEQEHSLAPGGVSWGQQEAENVRRREGPVPPRQQGLHPAVGVEAHDPLTCERPFVSPARPPPAGELKEEEKEDGWRKVGGAVVGVWASGRRWLASEERFFFFFFLGFSPHETITR